MFFFNVYLGPNAINDLPSVSSDSNPDSDPILIWSHMDPFATMERSGGVWCQITSEVGLLVLIDHSVITCLKSNNSSRLRTVFQTFFGV